MTNKTIFRDDRFRNDAGVTLAIREAMQNLVPPPDMLPSVWAEANVKIPVGNAIPGYISFDNAPHQREMLDVIKEPGIRRIDLMLAAQIGKTTVMQCISGYFIAHEPRSQIFAQPSQGDMQTFMETKLRPMFEANPAISSKMAKQRGREGVNNSRIMSYIGGWLMTAWSGSPKTARGRSAPVTQADEVDGMVPTPEGDFVELLSQRSATFGDLRLDVRSSTPTIKGHSRIETGFLEGDQRRYYVPCPHCGEAQVLRWENVSWTGRVSLSAEEWEKDVGQEHDPASAVYVCAINGCLWTDGDRIAAIRNAKKLGHGWKAAKPFTGHASFHAPEFLSTFRRLREIVQSYLDKISISDMQSFVNVSMAETWEETGERADPTGLMARAEDYPAQVPAAGVYITAGIDMQQDRLEAEAVAWCEAEQSYSIDYRVFWGDPLAGDVWDELDDWLAGGYVHESGQIIPIHAACLDTGGTGGYPQRAYEYLRGKTGRRLFGIKGVPGWGRPIVEKVARKQSGKNARKIDLFLVGTDEAKLVVMRRLALSKPGPGYCHFPSDRPAEWYNQLTSEKMLTKYIKGQPVREWHKPDKARNEALDCRVYALVALKIMQPSFRRYTERLNGRPSPQSTVEEFAKNTAETAMKLHDTLVAIKEQADPEIHQEEAPKPAQHTERVLPPKRTLKARAKGRNFATKW